MARRMQRLTHPPTLCIPLVVASFGKVLTGKASCHYESAMSFIAVVGSATMGREEVERSDLITRFRKHLFCYSLELCSQFDTVNNGIYT